jgi:murein DD-endopeptidase MepM/ murein hydrolase activator NlpD
MKTLFFWISSFVLVLALGAGCTDRSWPAPLNNIEEDDLLLTFGLYVTPDPNQNPIDPPERFTGYHTALDVEVETNELNQEVPVFAICDGEVVYRQNVEGYGGVLIQQCTYAGDEVTVLYGHLDLDSIPAQVGEAVKARDTVGNLGDHKSAETSENRKHLHLGIHKGTEIELRGYVQTEGELEAFIDPAIVLGY